MQGEGLAGLRVVPFESRRASEIAELIRRHGGEPLVAPSMREVPLDEQTALFEYVRRLDAAEIDVVVLMTGVGLRTLVDVVAQEWPRERVARALRQARLVARRPEPGAALRELGFQPDIVVPEPNTWREILTTIDAQLPVAGKRVAVQEYGVINRDLISGLEARGAEVVRVQIYRCGRISRRCARRSAQSATAAWTSRCLPARRRCITRFRSPIPTGRPTSCA